MSWKRGKVTFDDGTVYQADLRVNDKGEVWNARIYKEDGIVEEIDAEVFASKFGKTAGDVYPYTYEITE